MRDVPDIAMTAAIHDAYIIQVQGRMFYAAGTSAATPSLASVMALVLESAGARQGNANPTLYALANQQLTANGAKIFHDITSGNNSVPGVTGFNAGAGYDLVTGLGSVDASLLVNHWADRASANFTLSPSPASVTVAAGASQSITLTVTTQNGFASPVALSAGAPGGVSVSFSPSTLATSGSSTITIVAASNALPGTYTVAVNGTAGGLTRTTSITLVIAASPSFNLQANASTLKASTGSTSTLTLVTNALGGFRSAIAFSVSGIPKGVAATFSPASIASPGNGASMLRLTVTTSAVAGSYLLTVSARGSSLTRTIPVTLTIVVPTFTVAATATSASLRPAASAKIILTTSVSNGFKAPIAFAVFGLPKRVTAAFSPATIASPGNGISTLTVTSATGAAIGTYNLTVAASGGGLIRIQKLTLTLTR